MINAMQIGKKFASKETNKWVKRLKIKKLWVLVHLQSVRRSWELKMYHEDFSLRTLAIIIDIYKGYLDISISGNNNMLQLLLL